MANSVTKYLVITTALVAAYFITGSIGINIATVGKFITPVWPPAGIALAVILIFGYRYWLGVAIGSLLIATLVTHTSPVVTVISIFGQVLQAVIGAYIVHRFVGGKGLNLNRLRDAIGVALIGGIGCSVISATIGTTGLLIGGEPPSNHLFLIWLTWWLGDSLGILIFTPLIIMWCQQKFHTLSFVKVFRSAIVSVLLIAVTVLIFSGYIYPGGEESPFKFLLLPPLLWIALRFGQFGVVNSLFVISLTAISVVSIRAMAEHRANFEISLFILQTYLGVIAISFLILSAIIAERQRAEQEQRRLIANSVRLNKRHKYLQQVNEAKNDFISLASHQLRTPATGIKMYLGMLRDGRLGTLTAKQKKSINTAYRANERQISTINDLLTIAELDMGDFVISKSETDMNKLIKNVIAQVKPVIDDRKQTIRYECSPGTYKRNIDSAKIAIAIENLISNASKYSHDGQELVVRLEKKQNSMRVTVEDKGVGIPKREIKKLFKKFTRIENELSFERGGNGLGLYIVKQIIKLHTGTISVRSQPGFGTTFTISL